MPPRPRTFVDDLIRAALDGDRDSFDRLFDLGFAALWRAAARAAPDGAEAAAADWLRRAFSERLKAAECASPVPRSAPAPGEQPNPSRV
jgi:hypothetical protein